LEQIEQSRAQLGFQADPGSPVTLTDIGWFALYTTARHEKRVAQHLGQRQIDHYLPLYRSQRKWRDGSRVALDLPLFPNYLFVRIRPSERVRVLEIPGALRVLLGKGSAPVSLPDAIILALQSGLKTRKAEPHPFLAVGNRVRIRSGVFAGMEGVVVRNKNRCRLVLTLDHIMQSFSVELGLEDLEPISAM
jgi:transcription antitermination factor NusG